MENECRNAHGWEDRTDINLPIQHREGFDSSGTSRKPFKLGKLSNGVRVYSVEAFHAGFAMIVAWSVLSCLLVALTRETHGRPAAWT